MINTPVVSVAGFVFVTVSESAVQVHTIELIFMRMERDRVEKLSNRREDIERQGRFEFVRWYVLAHTCFSFQLNAADKKADNKNKLGACSLPPRCINEHGFLYYF
jgi:hypothetical protein